MKVVTLLSVLTAAVSVSAAENRLTELKDGTSFSLESVPEEIVVERRKDEPVRFSIEENGTTGYRWDVEWNTNECSVALDHRAPEMTAGRCGVPGRTEVSVVSKIYTPARVEFKYARPWETNVAPAKAVKLIVYTVGEAKSPLYPRNAVNRLLAAECTKRGILLTDWHLHLRGGMTPELAKTREDDFVIRSSAMENHGREWEIYDNAKLRDFAARSRAVNPKMPVGIQVNDRDWFRQIDAETRAKFDYILADTMIMGKLPSGRDNRLWMVTEIPDAEAWMREYFDHTMRILDEPISILANPTYLPLPIAGMYDRLWTEERMRAVIAKAVKRGVALEIQAESPYPSPRFLKLAKEMGAKFTFGTNNFDPTPKDLSRWLEAIIWLDLGSKDLWQPKPASSAAPKEPSRKPAAQKAETPKQAAQSPVDDILSVDPAAILELLPLAVEGANIAVRAGEREARHNEELRRKGVAEVPPSSGQRHVVDTAGLSAFAFDDWGELYIDRRFVTDDEMKTVRAIEAWIAKWFPAKVTKRTQPRQTAGAAGLPVFRGFEDARYQEHDELIARLTAEFNANKAEGCGGTARQADGIADLAPAMVKAHMIEESGGNGVRSKTAWAADPLQVNVPGDWGDEKKLVGLSKPAKRNEGTVEQNVRAAIRYLSRKGFSTAARPASERPKGFFDGWLSALRRYNGRRDRTETDRYYSDEYADKIVKRASNPDLFVPIEIKLAKSAPVSTSPQTKE